MHILINIFQDKKLHGSFRNLSSTDKCRNCKAGRCDSDSQLCEFIFSGLPLQDKKKKKKTTWIRTHIFHMLSLVSSFPLKIYTMGMD